MGIFSLTQEIAMDLGTANTVIIHNDRIVVDQPSVVALHRRSEKLEAIGTIAAQMRGKENPDIYTVRWTASTRCRPYTPGRPQPETSSPPARTAQPG